MQDLRRPALVLATYLGTFLASLDVSIVNLALPNLQRALQTDIAGLQWVINAYAITLSALMLSAGPLGDRYGHKRVWLVSVALFVMGSLLCAAASRLPLLIVGRTVQGVAGALLIPAAMPMLSHAFPDRRQRARAIGGWSAFSALALILGPLLGGILVEQQGWQSIFLINLPVGLLAVALGAWGIGERRHPQHAAFDPAGQLLSVIGLGALSYGLIALGDQSVHSPSVVGPLLLALIALALFYWVERRVSRPLLPLALFADRAFLAVNAASFVLGFSAYSSLFVFSLFFQQVQGHSAAAAGRLLLWQFVMMAGVSLLFGRIAARVPLAHLLVAGYLTMGLSLCAAVGFDVVTPTMLSATVLALLGIGMGLAVPATGAALMALAPAERAGIASATMNALRQAGMTLGIALLGSVMSLRAIDRYAAVLAAGADPDALAQARAAITGIAPMPLPAPALTLYRQSLAQGFAWAMLLAGVLALALAGWLYWRGCGSDGASASGPSQSLLS